ncbi:hypothetical protein Q8F55_005036 [Vanrija albida]|uniref:Uncharacterized protein n=1 Tax=Vanrija albida TaxID=181172 RepID=A0ABR3Q0R1_9TREE
MLPPLQPNPAAGRARLPTQIAYKPAFEPFTTTQYMTPEHESWRLEELERYQVDNLILDEWCFWYDRTVTSDEVDQRLASLITDMLYAFHHRIVDQATRQRYPVWELLESVRAVRDRLFPDTMGYRWEDERP